MLKWYLHLSILVFPVFLLVKLNLADIHCSALLRAIKINSVILCQSSCVGPFVGCVTNRSQGWSLYTEIWTSVLELPRTSGTVTPILKKDFNTKRYVNAIPTKPCDILSLCEGMLREADVPFGIYITHNKTHVLVWFKNMSKALVSLR